MDVIIGQMWPVERGTFVISICVLLLVSWQATLNSAQQHFQLQRFSSYCAASKHSRVILRFLFMYNKVNICQGETFEPLKQIRVCIIWLPRPRVKNVSVTLYYYSPRITTQFCIDSKTIMDHSVSPGSLHVDFQSQPNLVQHQGYRPKTLTLYDVC